MRCNRPKPILEMSHLLCRVLIVSVFLGINAISSVEAVTQIGPGDRIFFLGDQWATNRTASQTGFEVIRLSNYASVSDMKYVRNTLNLKLMVGLGGNVVPADRPPPDGARAPWPGDTMDAALSEFRRKLVEWLGTHSLDISAFHFNLEYNEEYYTHRYPDDPNDLAASKTKRVNALTDTMTLIIKNYQRTIRDVCDSLTKTGHSIGSYPKLWVFSAKGTGNPTYEELGCDWNALTSDPYAIDVPTIGVVTSTVSEVTHEPGIPGYRTWVPNLADLKIWGDPEHIRDLKSLTNGKPVVIQYHINGSQPHRNVYHLYWNDFRELARHFKALSAEGTSHFGGNYPVGYYQAFYSATIPHPDTEGEVIDNVLFTLDESGDPPTEPIPWENGQKYPARLWEIGEEGVWGYNAATNKHNKWEREFIANILSATGTPLTGHTVPKTTTWSGEIYLIGDVVIPSGVTLTIDPETVINFRPGTDVYESGLDTNISEIVIQNGGTLIANGSIQDPIIFQSSFRADGTDPSGEGWMGAIQIRNEEGDGNTYDPILYNPSKDDWGGIRNEGGTLTLQNCVISDAEVGVEVTSYQGKTTISETDMSANHFGLKVHEGATATQLELTNIGLYRNMKGVNAFLYGPGHVEMRNATIADNLQGSGFIAADGDNLSVKFKNTIVAFNTVGIYTEGTQLSSPTLTLQYCDVFGAPPSGADFQGVYTAMPTTSGNIGNVSFDPEFVARASETSEEYDYHLRASSPVINQGDPSMTEADNSTINMGRYGGTSEYTSVSNGGNNGGNSGGNNGGNSGDNSGGDNSGGDNSGGDNSGGSTSVPVFEDFEDGLAQGWTASAGTWSVRNVDGSNRYVMGSSTESINRAYKNVSGWSGGYVIEAKLKIRAAEGKVIFSQANQNESYRLDVMTSSNNFRLVINDALHNHHMTLNTNTWYDVKVEVTSSHVKAWLNGSLKHTVNVSGAPDGYIGVGSYGSTSLTDHVYVDDVRVTSAGSGDNSGSDNSGDGNGGDNNGGDNSAGDGSDGTETPSPANPGDFNGDGVVDTSDFNLFLAVFGTSEGDEDFDARMDMDGNGTVNVNDFLIFVNYFGSTS